MSMNPLDLELLGLECPYSNDIGIYTLADDNTLDELIALVNSIDLNWKRFPMCIIPNNDSNIKKLSKYCEENNISIMSKDKYMPWDEFHLSVYGSDKVKNRLSKIGKDYRTFRPGFMRKLASFNGDFKKFIYLDTDIIVNDSLDYFIDKLSQYDLIAHDKTLGNIDHIFNNNIFTNEFIKEHKNDLFCTGFFASKKDIISINDMESLVFSVLDKGIDIIYEKSPDQTILNYAMIYLKRIFINLGKEPNAPHDAQTYKSFEWKNGILYDKNIRVPYFHNIGVPDSAIKDICQGKENKYFTRYKNIFLKYRFLDKKISKGAYILGNDNVIDDLHVLINSIRYFNKDSKLCLIPYDEKSDNAKKLFIQYGYDIMDEKILSEIDSIVDDTFDGIKFKHVWNKRRRLRNISCWLGPYNEFLYLDADIVVFRNIDDFIDNLDAGFDFLSHDRTSKTNGIKWIFNNEIYKYIDKKVIPKCFNAGFWASKKIFGINEIKSIMQKAKVAISSFDFQSGVCAQPIINWIVLNLIERIGNISTIRETPEPWAGIKGMDFNNGLLFMNGKPVDYLHWAGKSPDNCYSLVYNFFKNI